MTRRHPKPAYPAKARHGRRRALIDARISERAKDLCSYMRKHGLSSGVDGAPDITAVGLAAARNWLEREAAIAEERGRQRERREAKHRNGGAR